MKPDDKNLTAVKTTEPAASLMPTYAIDRLFGSARQIRILHKGHEYRLSLTKADKLILTK